ncbi:MAG: hypothetical protein QM758_15955 [Armatimonas sp.]
MLRWLVLTFALIFLAAPANANGGMALVYGTFRWNYWLIYVAVTVLFEALVLGWWAKSGFGRALGISVGANAVTGLLGAGFSGIFGYMVYGVGASNYVEPNPLVHATFCLVVGGIISALIESIFWTKEASRPAVRATLLVHLAGVPLALMILLIPARPYGGLEGQANFRRHFVKAAIAGALEESIQSSESKPFYAPKNWGELIKRVQPALSKRERTYSNEVLQVTGFRSHFGRFDTREEYREPCEFNPALAGKDLRKLERSEWLVRWTGNGWSDGFTVEENGITRYVPNLNTWMQNRKRLP